MKRNIVMERKIKQITKLFVVVFVFCLTFGVTAPKVLVSRAASAPNIIGYQGRVLNANGVPVTDASVDIIFRLYDDLSAGSCVWSNSSADCSTATARAVTLTDGLFSENLGDTGDSYAAIGDSIFGDNAALYLDVNIEGESLTPRKQIVAAPYALNADTLDGNDSSAFLTTSSTLDDLYNGYSTSAAVINVDDNGNGANYGLEFAIADNAMTSTSSAIRITNNDVTNDPYALDIYNTSAGDSLHIQHLTNAGIALNIDQDTNERAIYINSAATSSDVMQVVGDSQLDADILDISADALRDGSAIRVASTSSALAAGDIFNVIQNSTYTTTTTRGGDIFDVDRVLTINGSGQTLTVSGHVMSLANTGTETDGTITDSSSILFLDQNFADSTGAALSVDSESTTGNVAEMDGSALTTGKILHLVGGNFTDDSGLALSIDVTESTETADIVNIQTDYSSSDNNVFRIEADGEVFSDAGFTAGAFSTNYYDGSITSTGAFTYEAATSFTWQDDAGTPNTLMTLTDDGTTGTLAIPGASTTTSIADGSITSTGAFTYEAATSFTWQDDAGTPNTLMTLTDSGTTGTLGMGGTSISDGNITSTGAFAYKAGGSFNWWDGDDNSIMALADGGDYGELTVSGNATITHGYDETAFTVTSDAATASAIDVNLDSITTGIGLDISNTSAAVTSGDLAKLAMTSTYTSSASYTGNLLDITRDLTINGLGETLTATGAIMSLTNNGTVTSGDLADSSSMLKLDQNYAGATGTVLVVDSAATAASGIAVQADSMLGARGIDVSVDALTAGVGIYLERANDAGSNYTNSTQGLLYVHMDDESSSGTVAHIESDSNAGYLLHIEHTGINSTTPALLVESDRSPNHAQQGINGFIAEFKNVSYNVGGGADTAQGIVIQGCQYANPSASCNLIEFRDGNGGVIGAVEGDGLGGVTAASAGSDYAELFPGVYADFEPGDVIALDGSGSVVLATEANDIIGTYSVAPNTLGNWFDNWQDSGNYVPVALIGQVPVKVNMEGGAIQVGDYITLSSVTGVAKKATGATKVIGQALESHTSGTGVIEVYVSPSWNAVDSLASDGSVLITSEDFALDSGVSATASVTSVDSPSLSLKGSAWNGSSAEDIEMLVLTDVTDANNYNLSILNNDGSEVASINESGDLAIAGRLYPSDRGVLQTDKYIYYDGSSGAGGDFMRTNASGWATGSYDFAEMFPSKDALAAGEVVTFSADKEHVRRSSGTPYDQTVAGIVSTKPGFLAGDNKEGDVPVALAGRVPTYVTDENGAIQAGDPLTTSSKPGYAMKATDPGPIIGYAMEGFSGKTGSITVFVNLSYYNGDDSVGAIAADNVASGASSTSVFVPSSGSDLYSGNLLNVMALKSIAGNWTLEEDGDFITKGRVTQLVESYQGEDIETYTVTSQETTIQLSGTTQLKDGRAHVYFDDINEDFKNIISTTADYRVLVTAAGPSGSLYVGTKERDGFIIRESNGTSNVKVDWLVIAYHKDYAPEEEIVEDNIPEEKAAPESSEEITPEQTVDQETDTPIESTTETNETVQDPIVEEEPVEAVAEFSERVEEPESTNDEPVNESISEDVVATEPQDAPVEEEAPVVQDTSDAATEESLPSAE